MSSSKLIDEISVWTAIITPMLDDGKIDYDSFKNLLHEQAEAGNGILLLGSTGEALNINDDEKKQILDFAIQENLNTPLMCGVGGVNLDTQLSWINYLNSLELDAYLLVVPLYAKPGIHGQYEWFKTLMDTSSKPCMLYNVPGRTAKKLEQETLRMLADHERIWALKEASGSEKEFKHYSTAAPEIRMVSGDDLMLPAFSKLGAKGVVSVAANVWPAATAEYARQCLSGELEDEDLWINAIQALFVASNPIPAKAILAQTNRIKSNKLRCPLSEKDMKDMSTVIEADKSVNEWYENLTNGN